MRGFTIAGLLVACACTPTAPPVAPAMPAAPPAEVAAIQAVLAEFQRALGAHDAAGLVHIMVDADIC